MDFVFKENKMLTRTQEIERSILTTYRSNIWANFIKAIKAYDLIKENDHICVCISGGKDSMLLAKLFQELNRHSMFNFKVSYLVMNPGYSEKNINLIKENLEILGIPAIIKDSNIFDVANAQDKNPCYLCARMRRGVLYKLAQELGCNKIALGHHFDDVIETTLMNLLNSGSFQSMLPKLHSQNFEGMELIRPMYYIREKDIIRFAKGNDLHFIQCACRFTENIVTKELKEMSSKRHETKMLIKELVKNNPLVEKNIFKSIENVNVDMVIGYKLNNQKHSFLDDYDSKEYKIPKKE